MYEELIGNLRAQATHFSIHDETSLLLLKAADAIEELQAQLMYSNDAAKAIAGKIPKWIPVTERLPEDHVSVLTCDGIGNVHIFSHYHGFAFPFGIKPTDPRYYMVKWWMPLPEPPKEINDGNS